MTQSLRWGILGSGRIAGRFANALGDSQFGVLQAVGSRSRGKADAFADAHGAPNRHGSYESLVADPSVDAIYVATPHPMHRPHSILALQAGKPVLCEKPFTVNAAEAREVAEAARAAGLFCMEAMWSRFLPSIRKTVELIDNGAIGEVRMVTADFGFRTEPDPESRLFNPALAGGGLLDVGVYPMSLAAMILGEPTEATGLADIGATGVDEQAAFVLRFAGGKLALCATGVRTTTPHEATIMGTDGWVRLPGGWWSGGDVIVHTGDGEKTIAAPTVGDGFNYQIDEVARCIAAGKTESDIMPLDESIALMAVADDLRSQWNLRYPME